MQLKQVLTAAVEHLDSSDVGSPRLNAETLLMFVLGHNRAYLYAHPERELTDGEQSRYNEVLAQRARGVPSQYITGHQEFWGLDLVVSPAVLIPRPETEHLVETVLELARPLLRPRIVDVGTGSGCIALALADELKDAEVWGVDVSAEALEIARANAARLQLGRVKFVRGDVLQLHTTAGSSASLRSGRNDEFEGGRCGRSHEFEELRQGRSDEFEGLRCGRSHEFEELRHGRSDEFEGGRCGRSHEFEELRQGRSDEFEGLRSGRDNEAAGFPPQARDGFFAPAEAVDRNDDGSEIENPPAEAVRRNDELNQLGNEFHHLDFVVSNPPYVGLDEADKVQRSVKEFEPGVAVFAGEHGLDVIRPLIEQAHQALKPGGWLAMEIGYSMRDAVLRLLTPTMWDETRVIPDLQGIPRVIAARKKSV